MLRPVLEHRVQITEDQVIARQASFTRVCQPYHLGYNFAFLLSESNTTILSATCVRSTMVTSTSSILNRL